MKYVYCVYENCTEQIPYYNVTGKCRKHWFKKDKDVMLNLVGSDLVYAGKGGESYKGIVTKQKVIK